MNTLLKIEILVSFPLGAKFYNNIDNYTYKQFLSMIHRLSCINTVSRCKDCTLVNQCQYYKITGENYSGYPGIFFKYHHFSKDIFRDNEEYLFTIYIIGNNHVYRSYVDIFFEEYLNHKLAGYYFNIKSKNIEFIKNKKININYLKLNSIIESTNFTDCYNNQINYYNSVYSTNYSLLNDKLQPINIKNINLNRYKLNTRSIIPRGYLYLILENCILDSNILEIGIGKYNYLGGGKSEIRN